MPYRQVYEPAPKDLSLPVHEKLPDGISEHSYLFDTVREAYGVINDEYRSYHFCHHCKGWIEGHANQYPVNTLNSHRLAGRSGTEYFCRRCGKEIGFFGMMS